MNGHPVPRFAHRGLVPPAIADPPSTAARDTILLDAYWQVLTDAAAIGNDQQLAVAVRRLTDHYGDPARAIIQTMLASLQRALAQPQGDTHR